MRPVSGENVFIMIPALTGKPQRTRATSALPGKSMNLFNFNVAILFLFLNLLCSIYKKRKLRTVTGGSFQTF